MAGAKVILMTPIRDWDVETDGDGSSDDLLYTFKCAPLIRFVTIFLPSKLARV